jgi:hypothetical protein
MATPYSINPPSVVNVIRFCASLEDGGLRYNFDDLCPNYYALLKSSGRGK